MKHILIGLLFLASYCDAQVLYHIKDNLDSDEKHKQFPAYIEVDTSQVEDVNDVIMKYNAEIIKPEGNRFYLKSKPFKGQTQMSINLTPRGDSLLAKKRPKQNFNTTEAFNKMHERDGFKILARNDSVELGQLYEAYIVIDTAKIDIHKLTVLFYDTPVKREENRFNISMRPMLWGPTFYDFSLVKITGHGNDTLKYTHNVIGLKPSKK